MPKKETKDLGVRLTGDVKDLRRKLTGLERDYDRHAKRVQATNKRMARGRASMGGAAAGRVGAGGVNRSIIAGGAAIAGSLGLLQAARETKMFNDQIVDMAVKTKNGSKWIANQTANVLKLSETWAKTPAEISAGMAEIIKFTGDAGLAVATIETLTQASFASGTEISELANVVNVLRKNLNISSASMPAMLDTLLEQANLGAVELEDMAQWFPVVLSGMKNLGWVGDGAAKSMGAFFQIARTGSRDVRNTAQSIRIFSKMVTQNVPKLNKLLKIEVAPGGALLQLPDLLEVISEGYVKMEKEGKKGLKGAFGLLMGEGAPAIGQAIALKREGRLTSELKRLTDPAGAAGASARMAKARAELDPLHKWNLAVAKMGADMKRFMLPLMSRFAKLMPTIAKAAKFALDNTEQLFALWVGAKAAKFFSQLIGAGRVVSAGGGASAPAGGGAPAGADPRGRYRRFAGSGLGRATKAGGRGLAVAGALGLGRGAFGGGTAERGADAAATMAALAGGLPGAIAGGTYFLTKAAVSIIDSEFKGTLNFGKEEAALRGTDLSADLGLRMGTLEARKKGLAPVSPADQAAADKKATRLSELQKKQTELFGGKGGASLLSRIRAEAAKPEAEALRAKFREMGGGLIGAPESLISESARSEQISEQVKHQIAQIEEMKKLRKSLDKLATQGVNAKITPESAKNMAKAANAAVRAQSGRVKN